MPASLQITLRDMPNSQALEIRIRDKVGKLEALFSHVIFCRVVVEMPHRHHQRGKEFDVNIDLGIPGSEIVANRCHHENPYVALRDAFEAVRRQLESHARRLRRETKAHMSERISYEEGFA